MRSPAPTLEDMLASIDAGIQKLLDERADKRVDGFDYAKLTQQIDVLLDQRLEVTSED